VIPLQTGGLQKCKDMGKCMSDEYGEFHLKLPELLPDIVGIRIDYRKRPFKEIGMGLETLGVKLSGIFKR